MISQNELMPPSPLSPTLSTISNKSALWKEKSPSELIPMLRNAFTALREKDKALKVTAVIGKSLLEKNIELASSYNQLLQNSSMNLVGEGFEEDLDSHYMEPSSTSNAQIEILEQKNTELANRLELLLEAQEELDRSHLLKARQLEQQIENLQHSLSSATHEIEVKNSKSKKTLTKDGQAATKTCCLKANLEMEQLKIEFDHVNQLKTQKEKKLNETIHDVCLLQQQHDLSSQEYEKLKRAFEAQTSHLEELNTSVEQYDAILTKLRDRGVAAGHFSSQHSSSGWTRSVTTQPNLRFELNRAYSSTMFHPNEESALDSILQEASVVETDALDDALSLIDRLKDEYDHAKFLQEERYRMTDLFDTEHYDEDDILQELRRRLMEQDDDDDDDSECFSEQPVPLFKPKNWFGKLVFTIIHWIFFYAVMIISFLDAVTEAARRTACS